MPALRIVVILIALSYLMFIIVEHFALGNKRKISPYIVVKMVSIISLCPNDLYVILGCDCCGMVGKAFALLRMYFEPIQQSHMSTDLTSKFIIFDYIFQVDEAAMGAIFEDVVVIFFWVVFTLRKVLVYFLVNSFKVNKLSKFSEINIMIMLFFMLNLEGGLINLIKTELFAHYFIYVAKKAVEILKENVSDMGEDEDDMDENIGIANKAV